MFFLPDNGRKTDFSYIIIYEIKKTYIKNREFIQKITKNIQNENEKIVQKRENFARKLFFLTLRIQDDIIHSAWIPLKRYSYAHFRVKRMK